MKFILNPVGVAVAGIALVTSAGCSHNDPTSAAQSASASPSQPSAASQPAIAGREAASDQTRQTEQTGQTAGKFDKTTGGQVSAVGAQVAPAPGGPGNN